MKTKKQHIDYYLEERLFFGLLNSNPLELDELSAKDPLFKIKLKYGIYNMNLYPEYRGLILKYSLPIRKKGDNLYEFVKQMTLDFIELHKDNGIFVNGMYIYNGNSYNYFRIIKTFLKNYER